MATVTLRYVFADGDRITVSVAVEDSYPDAIDEARATASRAFREAIADGITAITTTDDED